MGGKKANHNIPNTQKIFPTKKHGIVPEKKNKKKTLSGSALINGTKEPIT